MTELPGCSTLTNAPFDMAMLRRKAVLQASAFCSAVKGSDNEKPAGNLLLLILGRLNVPKVKQGGPACQSRITPRSAKLSNCSHTSRFSKSPKRNLEPFTSTPGWTEKPHSKNFPLNGGFEMNGGSKHLFPRMSCSLTLMLVPKPFLCRERAILLVPWW